MIHDDSKPDDAADNINDDADIDDLELDTDDFEGDDFGEDAFDDESWDLEDDSQDDTSDDMPGVQIDDPQPDIVASDSSAPTSQKTMLQKFFIPIVVAIVAIFAGLFYVAQFGFKKSPDNTVSAQLESPEGDTQIVQSDSPLAQSGSIADLGDDNGMPPMPNPIVTQSEDTLQNDSAAVPADEALTPLPGTTENAQETPPEELADLDDILQNSTDIRDASPVVEIEEEALLESPIIADTNTDINDGQSDTTSPGVVADIDSVIPDISLEEIPAEEAFEDVSRKVLPETIQPPQADDIVVSSSEVVSAELAPPVQEIVSAKLDDEINELQAKKETLMAENELIASQITDSTTKVEDLKRRLDSLQKEISDAEQTLKEKKEVEVFAVKTVETPPKQHDLNIQMNASAPVAAIVSSVAPAPAPMAKPKLAKSLKKQKTQWVLRSAAPGKASLSEKGSNEFQSVEVGSTVKGLGKITFIGIENGLWVVRGTQGTVTQ